MLVGTLVLTAGQFRAYYDKASALRQDVLRDFTKVFAPQPAGVDVILTPTMPGPPRARRGLGDPGANMYADDILTVAASLAGLPAMSVPLFGYGGEEQRQASSLQLVGSASEPDMDRMLRAAAVLEGGGGDEGYLSLLSP